MKLLLIFLAIFVSLIKSAPAAYVAISPNSLFRDTNMYVEFDTSNLKDAKISGYSIFLGRNASFTYGDKVFNYDDFWVNFEGEGEALIKGVYTKEFSNIAYEASINNPQQNYGLVLDLGFTPLVESWLGTTLTVTVSNQIQFNGVVELRFQTETVPEPSALAFLGVITLGLLSRKCYRV